jgi:hypothetical protein
MLNKSLRLAVGRNYSPAKNLARLSVRRSVTEVVESKITLRQLEIGNWYFSATINNSSCISISVDEVFGWCDREENNDIDL